ncbi:hypothetical protein [Glutamicibacter sp. NPDC087344]|uniref:hypothetical protein n=1 Tax=Glutamicibacter sp. NPDC087344 TaxID=3363994 RepID=UPI003820545F
MSDKNEQVETIINEVTSLLETDPEYAKTLGVNAQGISYLHGAAAGVNAQPGNEA